MRLNLFETLLMNNPARAAMQRFFETRRLIRMGGTMTNGGRALEVGCGRGVGIKLVMSRFGADRVEAFDLDPKMVRRADRRLGNVRPKAAVWVGDVTSIPVSDRTYDAVFDFGILHHVPRWQDGLKEIYRVLKPAGKFYAEEILKRFIVHPLVRPFFDHPLDDRFDHRDFQAALERTGFEVRTSNQLMGLAGFYVSVRPDP